MKYFFVFVGFALFVGILQAAPQNSKENVGAMASWPAQTVCTNLKALPFKTANSPSAITFKLYVGKIKASPYTPVIDPNAPTNLCSPLTYADSCRGSQTLVEIRADGTKIVKTASYNEATKDVICSEQSFILEDPNYHVFHGVFNKMSVINEDGTVKEITTIPQSIIDLQNKQVVTLQYGPNLSFGIYAACDESAVWVAYAGSIVSANRIKEFDDLVNQALKDLGFDPKLFVNVPVEIPVNVDPCLQLPAVTEVETKTGPDSDSDSDSNSSGD